MSSTRSAHPAVFRPLQAKFLTIPQTPLCYWLGDRFFELLAARTVGHVATLVQQLITADNDRFLRFVWEVEAPEGRWLRYVKGGGYGRWLGYEQWLVDWHGDGAAIKENIVAKYPYLNGKWSWLVKTETFFRDGWTYSNTVRGCLGVRRLTDDSVADSKSPALLPREEIHGLGAILNSRVVSYLLRSLSASLDFRESYVARIPLPQSPPHALALYESGCMALKAWLVGRDPTERSFAVAYQGGPASLAAAHELAATHAEAVAAVLHALEGLSEHEVFAAYGIAGDDLAAVLDETGTPAGLHPLIEGYDQLPPLPEGLEVSEELLNRLAAEPRRALSTTELSSLKTRLSALYEAGPGAAVEAEKTDGTSDGEDEDEEEAAVSGARIPIPAETFVEELSQKLEIHPVSVYWLLRELRAKGVVCAPERRRFVEDLFSVMVLRLLGHRWPRQIESGEPPAPWQDRDGIIPISEGTGEPTLLAGVRERLADDFGPDRVNAVEAEFGEIVGRALFEWLAADFFRRHISQFRKRPIAWQVQSAPEENGKRRGRGGRRRAPVFSCLIYYHRVDADLLPKLRSQYIGPLRARLATELAGVERVQDRTDEQNQRRDNLLAALDELKAFDARLEEVIASGFHSASLETVAAKEPLNRFMSRDGRAPAPASRDALLAQERRYDPDVNDGVRVNIAPLQRAGLLAADVLAPKGVEKAIGDRAEWRADERRWCREGKLPQPGWWSMGADPA